MRFVKKTSGVTTLLLLLFLQAMQVRAQVILASSKASKFSIVTLDDAPQYKQAAQILQNTVQQASGASLSIGGSGGAGCSNCVVIGTLADFQAKGLYRDKTLTNKGVFIDVKPGRIMLAAQDSASMGNPVYVFLERYLNVHCFEAGKIDIPGMSTIKVPEEQYIYSSPFSYRDVYYEDAIDPTFRQWNMLRPIQDKGSEWGNFVHTIGQFISFDTYYKSNPEYFALVNNRRMASQVDYSREEVYNIVRKNLQSAMAQHPDKTIWSVSQMDNNDFCQCPICAAKNKQYGVPNGGAMIEFVNRLAKDFPDKTISTLAYGGTVYAPKNINLAPNLNIMFCASFGNKGIAARKNPTSTNNLIGWSNLTKNIFVWDYVVNFKNFLMPLPNYFVLADNIQFYQQLGVKGFFIQGDTHPGGEFGGLRAYLLSQMLWNPSQDYKTIMKQYLDYAYGDASGDVMDIMNALASSSNGVMMTNYDDPAQYASNIFSDVNSARYQNMLSSGMSRVKQGSDQYKALQRVGVSLNYTQAEILKHNIASSKDRAATAAKLKKSLDRLSDYRADDDVQVALNEGNSKLSDYVSGNRRLADVSAMATSRLIKNATVQYANKYSASYTAGGDNALLDGLQGTAADIHNFWQGFYDNDLSLVVDLGGSQTVSTVGIGLLDYPKGNIYLPSVIKFSVSADGTNFIPLSSKSFNPKDNMADQQRMEIDVDVNKRIRFIKIEAPKNQFSTKSWIFADEIQIN